MESITNGLIVLAFFAVLGAGAWAIDKVDKFSRRSREETPAERVQSSKPALFIGAIFLALVLGVAVHLNGGLAKTLAEATGGDPEFAWRR